MEEEGEFQENSVEDKASDAGGDGSSSFDSEEDKASDAGGDDSSSSSFDSEDYDHDYCDTLIYPYPKPKIECCWDPEDQETYEHFEEDKRKGFYALRDQSYHIYGNKILKYGPVFELYSITINKLGPKQQDFSYIYMRSNTSHELPMIIYKKPEDKNILLGETLPLKGPIRPPTPYWDVFIIFSRKQDWSFYLNTVDFTDYFWGVDDVDYIDKFDFVVTEPCMDEDNTSEATIVYRVISSGARVELSFTIFEEGGRNVYLTAGAITAVDVNERGEVDQKTLRIIQEYSKEVAVSVPSNEVLEVKRCQFGVPLGFCLRVHVKLAYVVDGYPDEEKKIEGCLDFKARKHVTTQLLATPFAANSFTKIFVQAFWTSPTADLPI